MDIFWQTLEAYLVGTAAMAAVDVYEYAKDDAASTKLTRAEQIEAACSKCGSNPGFACAAGTFFVGGAKDTIGAVTSFFGAPDVAEGLGIAKTVLASLFNPIPGLIAVSVSLPFQYFYRGNALFTVLIAGLTGATADLWITYAAVDDPCGS